MRVENKNYMKKVANVILFLALAVAFGSTLGFAREHMQNMRHEFERWMARWHGTEKFQRGEIINAREIAENFEYLYSRVDPQNGSLVPPECWGPGKKLGWKNNQWICEGGYSMQGCKLRYKLAEVSSTNNTTYNNPTTLFGSSDNQNQYQENNWFGSLWGPGNTNANINDNTSQNASSQTQTETNWVETPFGGSANGDWVWGPYLETNYLGHAKLKVGIYCEDTNHKMGYKVRGNHGPYWDNGMTVIESIKGQWVDGDWNGTGNYSCAIKGGDGACGAAVKDYISNGCTTAIQIMQSNGNVITDTGDESSYGKAYTRGDGYAKLRLGIKCTK